MSGGSVIYYSIPGDKFNLKLPVGVALSRHFECSSGVEAHSYLLSISGAQSPRERKIISRQC